MTTLSYGSTFQDYLGTEKAPQAGRATGAEEIMSQTPAKGSMPEPGLITNLDRVVNTADGDHTEIQGQDGNSKPGSHVLLQVDAATPCYINPGARRRLLPIRIRVV